MSEQKITNTSLHYSSRRKIEKNMLKESFQKLDVAVCMLLHMLPKMSMIKLKIFKQESQKIAS